jgi:hypothetical protein
MKRIILLALLLTACAPQVMVVEVTPPPPIGVYREERRIDLTNGFTLQNTAEPADTEFIRDFWKHEYEIPEQVGDEVWLEVVLDEQALYVHEGERLVAGFRISSGRQGKATKTGLFRIYAMYPSYPMWGPIINGVPEYWIPDVPWAMFYHVDFAIHGAYWHDDFGTPVSHGCVNMNPNDAEWVYGNVRKGTYVWVR